MRLPRWYTQPLNETSGGRSLRHKMQLKLHCACSYYSEQIWEKNSLTSNNLQRHKQFKLKIVSTKNNFCLKQLLTAFTRRESAPENLKVQFCHFPWIEHQFILYDKHKERANEWAREVHHLQNSRRWEGDLDFLIFSHQDGGDDLTCFSSVEERVFEREQIRTCYRKHTWISAIKQRPLKARQRISDAEI